MVSPLRRAAVLLLLTACTRGAPSTPAPSPASPAGRAKAHASAQHQAAQRSEQAPARPANDGTGCPGLASATSAQLVDEAWAAVDEGSADRALACAEAAVEVAPRSVAALSARAGALAAADRVDEARTAYARALAVDPDDPETLYGAAEVYVRRMGAARDVLETGLEHALRGIRSALRRHDRAMAGRLEFVAGMAENDLGHSHLALPHLERAAGALPDDADVIYEKGVALFELCRFEEAQRAFERALVLAPDDPWSLHELGLLAERRGEERRATALLAKARTLAPREFGPELEVSAAEFKVEVESALTALPSDERRALRSVPVEIQDLPDTSDLLAVKPPLSPSILGLFRGPSEDEDCTPADGPRCRTIVLYRKNLLRFARDRRELSQEVKVTLLHELGHLHGLDDEQLRARGLE